MKDLRREKPKIKELDNPKIQRPKTYELDNGVKAYVVNGAPQEVTNIQIIFPAGNWFEQKKLAADFTSSMFLEGTLKHSSREIAEIFNHYGARTSFENSDDYAYVELQSLNKFLDNLIPWLSEILFEPNFPIGELEIKRKQAIDDFLVKQKEVNFVALKTFKEALFGKDHPYGYYPDVSDYENITREDLQKFYANNYNIDNSFIVVSGNPTKDIVDDLNKGFGQLSKAKGVSKKVKHPRDQEKSKWHTFIERQDALQSAVYLGCETISLDHPDYYPFLLLLTVLGAPGYFNGRLMQNIREKKGYTYGIYARVSHLRHSSYLRIWGEVKAQVTTSVIEEVHKEIKLLKNKRINETELKMAKNFLKSGLLRQFDNPFNQANTLIQALQYDLDYIKWYENLFTKIRTTTSEELQELANKYLDSKSLIEVVVGKE